MDGYADEMEDEQAYADQYANGHDNAVEDVDEEVDEEELVGPDDDDELVGNGGGQEDVEEVEEAEADGDAFSNVGQGLVGHHRDMMLQYWQNTINNMEREDHKFRVHQLPLARIKKVMKADEDVKMISAEAPILFAKGCDIFITELTMRAWIHAEENKRRTLQRSDIASALQKSDMFDFLIDIVPREDANGSRRHQQQVPQHHHQQQQQMAQEQMAQEHMPNHVPQQQQIPQGSLSQMQGPHESPAHVQNDAVYHQQQQLPGQGPSHGPVQASVQQTNALQQQQQQQHAGHAAVYTNDGQEEFGQVYQQQYDYY